MAATFPVEILVFGAGFLAALLGSIAGGGGSIITVMSLIGLGFPAANAIAINRTGDLGLYPGSLRNFWKSGAIDARLTLQLTILHTIPALLGIWLVTVVSEDILRTILGITLAIVGVVALRRNFGQKPGKNRKVWIAAYGGTAVADGAVGAGTGALATASLIGLRGMTALPAIANHFSGSLLSVIIGIFWFAGAGLIDPRIAAWIFVGNLLGGYAGSKLALRGGNRLVRAALIGATFLAAVQLLVF